MIPALEKAVQIMRRLRRQKEFSPLDGQTIYEINKSQSSGLNAFERGESTSGPEGDVQDKLNQTI